MQIVKPGTKIDFVGKRRPFGIASIVVVTLAVVIAVAGTLDPDLPGAPKYGVDFAGGTLIQLRVADGVSVGDIRAGLSELEMNDDSVQAFGGGGNEYLIRVDAKNFGADEFFDKAAARLEEVYPNGWTSFEWQRGQSVSMRAVATEPRVPAELEQELLTIKPGVAVVESKVEHNSYEVSYPGLTQLVKDALAGKTDDGAASGRGFEAEVLRVEMVGPTVGAELRRQGLLAIFFSLALILVYVAFRFDLSFAPGAVAALFHDVTITIGIFCLLGREFSLPTIGALLTIVGYSLNDTIVVYDRIRENLRRFPRRDLSEVINISLNETLSRTLLTSVTTLIAVTALIILGGPIIQDFAIALFVGVLIGTYSSVFVASPLILTLQKWVPVDVQETSASNRAGSGARL